MTDKHWHWIGGVLIGALLLFLYALFFAYPQRG